MHAVFLDQKTFSEEVSISAINAQVSRLTCYPNTSENQLLERCLNADIIIVNKTIINEALLKQLPKLALICIAATGTNNVDLEAAKQLNIAVMNVSGYSSPSVTQYVFAQILAYYSQIEHHNNNVAQGKWQQHSSFCYHGNGSSEIAGKTLSIIGYGALGKSVAKVAQAFGMNILIAERPNATHIRAGRVNFNDALSQGDIVSLHCPETADTVDLMNDKTLALMKPSAMLINTARGALVNSEALVNALKSNKIACAALDVLDQEPPAANHPLLQCHLPNLVITAHIAWASIEAQQRLLELIALNIAHFKVDNTTNRVV